MPTTSSRFSPITGIREKPLRSASDIAWREVLVALDEDHVGARHHHLAHDGVAELEHRVDHLALAGLDHRGASARSTSSRSSVSVENGPSRKPRPGSARCRPGSAAAGAGPSTAVIHVHGPARAERHALRRAGGRGCAAPTPIDHERDDQPSRRRGDQRPASQAPS